MEEEDADAEQVNLRGGTVVVVVTPNDVVGLDILREASAVKEEDGS